MSERPAREVDGFTQQFVVYYLTLEPEALKHLQEEGKACVTLAEQLIASGQARDPRPQKELPASPPS